MFNLRSVFPPNYRTLHAVSKVISGMMEEDRARLKCKDLSDEERKELNDRIKRGQEILMIRRM